MQDYDLSAVFMRNWDTRDEYGDSNKGCEWEKDWDDVQKACKVFDIPCQLVIFHLLSHITNIDSVQPLRLIYPKNIGIACLNLLYGSGKKG
jgi:hypothetical protein